MSRWPTPPLDEMIPKIVEVKMTDPMVADLTMTDRGVMIVGSRVPGGARVDHR